MPLRGVARPCRVCAGTGVVPARFRHYRPRSAVVFPAVRQPAARPSSAPVLVCIQAQARGSSAHAERARREAAPDARTVAAVCSRSSRRTVLVLVQVPGSHFPAWRDRARIPEGVIITSLGYRAE